MFIAGSDAKRHAGVDHAIRRTVVDGAREEVESDQGVDLELAPLQLGVEVGAAGDEHRARAVLRGHARGLARGARRLDFDRRRVGNGGKARRPVARRLTFIFAPQRLDHFLRRDWNFVDPHAERVMDRGANRRWHREQRSLARLLRSVRSLRVVRLHDERLDLGHVEERRRLVLQHRRPFVQALAEDLLFHQGLAESHVHAALDLALDQERIDRAPDVVRDPDLVDADQPGACVGV